jgi:SAM-dependent methyltransferase
MDLRPYLNRNDPVRASLFERGISLIQQGALWYQPFILADGMEVGEGQNLEDQYRNCESLFDNNVFLSDQFTQYWVDNPRKLATDGEYFAHCNRKYRYGYDLILNTILNGMGGDISKVSFLELGCNTGLNLFNLATRGAASCTGIDWTDHSQAVAWLNDVLGTEVAFLQGSYDNLLHTVPILEVPQADVVINTVFLNHQCDPVQFLCYLADHAKKALFLWVLLHEGDERLSIYYGPVSGIHDLGAGKPLPLSFHNDVSVSVALFRSCLQQLGFGEIEFIGSVGNERLPKSLQGFQMVWAKRTEDRPSGYAIRQDPLQNKIKELELEKSMLRSAIENAARHLGTVEDELSTIRNSYSFRIGRMATAPIRAVRRALAGLVNRD